MRTKISKFKFQLFLLLFIGSVSFGNLLAQNTGVVRGTISDAYGFLPGAHVVLVGTIHSAVTGMDGKYLFYDVAPKTYTLEISYIGFNKSETQVTVPASGGTVVQHVKMVESATLLNEVTITGNRAGQAKALNTQKESNTVKNVVSEEQIKSFPDLNTAEVLQRVSGVTIQRDMGEGRFVALRGTSPSLTNVTVNGEQIAVSSGDFRRVELDVISADQLSGIEVTKVITPDMDGNAIGGSVNLKTRSAFDRSGRLFNVKIGAGKNGLADGNNYRASFDYSDIFGANDNFGLTIGANWAVTNRERHNNEHKWGNEDDVDDNEIAMALKDTEIHRSRNQRDRLGINAQLEYKFSEDSKIFVSGMYNYRWDDQDRELTKARFDKGDYISRTQVEEIRFVRSIHDRFEKQKVTSFMLGGEHQLGKVKMDYKYSRSNAFTKKDEGQVKPEFELRDVNVTITDINSMTPGWTVTGGDDPTDNSNFVLDAVDLKYENTTNIVNTYTLNFTMPMVLGSNSGELIFGGKARRNKKDRGDVRQKWKWKGDDDLLLSQFEIAGEDFSLVDDTYNLGTTIDRHAFRKFFFDNQAPDKFESEDRNDVNFGEPYDATETINAAYAMTTQTYGKLMVLAGLRAEFAKTDYSGTTLVLDDKEFVSATEINVKRSFTNFFPNLQFRYRATDNTNFRLAYSKGIAMPEFFDMVPYEIISYEEDDGELEGEIRRGNGQLDPTTSSNFDLLGEHFFKGIGVLSGGIFMKKMDNFIFLRTGTEEYGAKGLVGELDTEQPINGDGAKLFGVELTWQQQFTKLPGFLSGLGIYANYTYTKSSDIDLGPDTDRTDIDLLPFQMENVSNLALTYQKGKITARLAGNFSGKFIEEVGEDQANDEWRDSFNSFDFSAGYKISDALDFFIEVSNITNEPRYNYIGVSSRAREHGINGVSVNTGIKWSL